jgi:hypothetical protein
VEGRNQSSTARRPHWTAILLGRLTQFVCPYAKEPCPDESCKLRYFCKCAQQQECAVKTREDRLWGALALCGLSALLIWLFW